MDVNDIPIPAAAAIKVTKGDKSAVFHTTVIQTTDNKYIYAMPVRIDEKLVNFEIKGCFKELKIEFAPFEFYSWRNIVISKFVEDGKNYLRIRAATPGVKALAWPDKPVTSMKNLKAKKSVLDQQVIEEVQQEAK